MIIVYSYYVLDILHAGHLRMMKNAKAMAGPDGRSIVGILTDAAVMEKKPRPVLSLEERMELAESIRYVDGVVVQETYSPLQNVRWIRPDILLESSSHAPKDIEKARAVMKEIQGRVVVIPYFPDQSSTRIKEEIARLSKGKKNEGPGQPGMKPRRKVD